MCPLGPTGFGDSPYQCFSAFALNPYFVDWDTLLEAGLVSHEDLGALYDLPHERVDYGLLYARFWPVLQKAFDAWKENPAALDGLGNFEKFCKTYEDWLKPYTCFSALKRFHKGAPWWLWPPNQRCLKDALSSGVFDDKAVKADVEFFSWAQFVCFSQFAQLKDYAQKNGVRLIGDIPIFVAHDSADTWGRPELFQMNAAYELTAQAGVPPDYFSPLGQLWGNPLYDWPAHKKEKYRWWIARFKAAFGLYDRVRLDHFRGFEAYWKVPADAKDARKGVWEKGPGLEFFKAIKDALPQADIIAEDLGVITPELRELLARTGLPGMAVLQFAFGSDAGNLYLPHNLVRNSVVYTGTHDNDTSKGWYASTDEKTRDYFRRYLRSAGDSPNWDLIHAAYKSVSACAVVPLQDFLNLGSEARFNTPGQSAGNWQWRFSQAQFDELHTYIAPLLKDLAEQSGRVAARDGQKE